MHIFRLAGTGSVDCDIDLKTLPRKTYLVRLLQYALGQLGSPDPWETVVRNIKITDNEYRKNFLCISVSCYECR